MVHLLDIERGAGAVGAAGLGSHEPLAELLSQRVFETPGHTPEGVSVLVYDLDQDAAVAHAVLTGDALFIGDVGRPDLIGSLGMTAGKLASMLYRTVQEKFLPLDDSTLVYPAHGAGSLCGRSLSAEPFSTIGEQRKYNYALQPMSEEEFVSLVTLDQPAAPDYFLHDAIMNRKEHQILSASLVHALKPLGVREVLDLQKTGAQLLDVRAAIDYEGGHIRESINVGLNGKFASYAGTVLTPDAAIVLIAEPGFEKEAAVRLGRIGFDHVVGFLDGGMASLDDTSGVITQTVRITPVALEERLHQGPAPFLLDVRTGYEHRDGRIKGSKNIPLNDLKMRIQEVPTDEPVAVFCESGYRSAMALGLLEKQGLKDVLHVVGGMAAWRASRLETIS